MSSSTTRERERGFEGTDMIYGVIGRLGVGKIVGFVSGWLRILMTD